MQGNQIFAVGFEITDLVNVGILAAAAMAGRQLSAARCVNVACGGAVEQGFRRSALEYADAATAGAVIVNRAALAISPAEY